MFHFSNAEPEEISSFYDRVSSAVRLLRKEKKISQLELANTIGMGSVTFFTNAENRKYGKHFNLEHLYKIAKALEVDLCELLQDKQQS